MQKENIIESDDFKRFKKEHEDLYNEYQVSSERKAYVKFN